MTDMIQINRTKLVDAFVEFLASADPVKPSEGTVDVQTITHLAEKGRELAAEGAFRNKTIYAETLERLARGGYSQAEIFAISEIGLQIGRAVNTAFMNAAGVYSSTAKLLKTFEKEAEAANDEQVDEYVPADLKDQPADPVGVAAAIDRVAKKYDLAH